MSSKEKKTILLVEDEAIISMVQAKTIMSFGYNVLTANSGDEAVQIAGENEAINLILMDINLGKGKSGSEAAKLILSKRNIPIVFLTSHSEQKIADKVLGITSYGYVIKNSGDFVLRASIEMAFELYEANEKIKNELAARKKAESANLRNLKFTEALLKAIPTAVFFKDSQGLYLGCNKTFSEIMGVTNEEIQGKTVMDLWPSDLAEIYHHKDIQLISNPEHQVYDSKVTNKKGETFDVIFTKNVFYDDTGKVAGIVGTFIDITDRKIAEEKIKIKNEELESANEELNAAMEEVEASNEELISINQEIQITQEALKAAEEMYRNIFLNAQIGIFRTDINTGLIIDANDSVARFAGYKNREELLSRPFNIAERYADPKDREILISLLKEHGQFSNFETRFIRNDGSIIWMRFSGKIVPGKDWMEGISEDITEQKLAEAKKIKSETLLLEMTTQVPGVVYQFYARPNGEMGFNYVSDRSEQVLGIKPDLEKYFERFTALVIPEFRESFIASIEKSVKESIEWKYEGIMQKPSGEKIWFSGNSIPSLRENEIVFNGIVSDITERKKAESKMEDTFEKMQLKDEQFDFITSNMMDIIAFTRPDGTYKYISPSCQTILGYSPGDMESVSGFRLNHPEDIPRVKKMYADALAQKKSHLRYDTRLIHKEGHYLPYEVFLKIIYDKDGELNGFLLTSRDITERIKAEEALRASEEKYRFLTDNMNDIIWTTDMNFRTTYVSPSIETVLGFMPEERMKQGVAEQITSESINKIKDAFVKEITLEQQGHGASQKIFNFELDFYHKDGSTRVMEIVASKIRNEQGVWTGLLGVSRDITDRKQSEDALRNLQKLESLGVLAGGIAHDFNNLLGGIFGYIDLASSSSKEAEVLEYLNESLTTINRARALTNQLLTFSKGGAPVRKTESLFHLISETVQFALSGSNVSNSIEIENDLYPCNIDKNQIGQVIDNIIINAQQAMPMGGTIEVTAKNIPQGNKEHSILQKGRYVKISIKDFGIGIPKDIIPHIFDPFFTTKTKGHGLGLATSFSIVNRHEGLLDIESVSGKGSTFHIYLPASKETASSVKQKQAVIHKGSGTIIVMDDEEFIRNTLEKMLKTQGYNCVLMKDGKEVLEFLREEYNAKRVIAGIILDLTIPGGLGGKEIVSIIREIDPIVPILVISGYADDPVIADPKTFGFTASIGKPFTIAELAAVLEKHLKQN